MTEVWNPYDKIGVMPFHQFNTWNDLLEHYVVPKNEILRAAGPGEAIQPGEWYLTPGDGVKWQREVINQNFQDFEWYLSYVGPNGFEIKIIHAPSNLNEAIDDSFSTHKWDRWNGSKDGWGRGSKIHYKVEIGDVINFVFLNWKENPFEVKQ